MTHYTISAAGQAGSKARLRAALRMMGFDGIRISEVEAEASKPAPKPDNVPTSAEAKAVAALFHRKAEAQWADEEIKAFKTAIKTGLLTLENMKTVATFYERERKKADNYCRTSILTFCRHFGTELDKACAQRPKTGKALEWAPSNKIVPMPEPMSEEARRAGVEQLRKLREERGHSA